MVRTFGVENSFEFIWRCLQALWRYDETKVRQLRYWKQTFLPLKTREHFKYPLPMLLNISAFHQNIINVTLNPRQVPKHVIHHTLEYAWCRRDSEWHPCRLEQTNECVDGSMWWPVPQSQFIPPPVPQSQFIPPPVCLNQAQSIPSTVYSSNSSSCLRRSKIAIHEESCKRKASFSQQRSVRSCPRSYLPSLQWWSFAQNL